MIRTLSSNFGGLGYLIVMIFVASWAIAAVIYRAKGYNVIDADDS